MIPGRVIFARAMDAGDLSHYEIARLVGYRAEQLEQNQPPRVAVPAGVTCAIAIALLELKAGVLPARIRRRAHGGGGSEAAAAARGAAPPTAPP